MSSSPGPLPTFTTLTYAEHPAHRRSYWSHSDRIRTPLPTCQTRPAQPFSKASSTLARLSDASPGGFSMVSDNEVQTEQFGRDA